LLNRFVELDKSEDIRFIRLTKRWVLWDTDSYTNYNQMTDSVLHSDVVSQLSTINLVFALQRWDSIHITIPEHWLASVLSAALHFYAL
jgi:hypothetical protein